MSSNKLKLTRRAFCLGLLSFPGVVAQAADLTYDPLYSLKVGSLENITTLSKTVTVNGVVHKFLFSPKKVYIDGLLCLKIDVAHTINGAAQYLYDDEVYLTMYLSSGPSSNSVTQDMTPSDNRLSASVIFQLPTNITVVSLLLEIRGFDYPLGNRGYLPSSDDGIDYNYVKTNENESELFTDKSGWIWGKGCAKSAVPNADGKTWEFDSDTGCTACVCAKSPKGFRGFRTWRALDNPMHLHTGIDINYETPSTEVGEKVYAVKSGYLCYVNYMGTRGWQIGVAHDYMGKKIYSGYLHVASPYIKDGDGYSFNASGTLKDYFVIKVGDKYYPVTNKNVATVPKLASGQVVGLLAKDLFFGPGKPMATHLHFEMRLPPRQLGGNHDFSNALSTAGGVNKWYAYSYDAYNNKYATDSHGTVLTGKNGEKFDRLNFDGFYVPGVLEDPFWFLFFNRPFSILTDPISLV